MKKILISLALVSGVMASPAALAAEQTASIGYAHAQLQMLATLMVSRFSTAMSGIPSGV
ncbi:hypothetical protein AAGU66_14495 [Edwardsiella ictaluri]|uniref:hypothetical protein n=1 Tax=Edwardsiella ictaluri TaxID=67780 RepID=UPI001E620F9D|nr:hypothetical protein [Edwardsiella ictaluri]UYB61247.1 hypothetical protein N8I66_14980 [Edwardsiella ictaluri]UYB64474.1 hypothetical protein N8I67_14975 [Edwardsiella ictaluri]BEI00193.1 hypothetical protein KH20906_29200 [Edwardsiella ictaluri]BEI03670.1 hypothetical protein KB20921_29310 [Edwardsiella ictaluri]BEI14076.1 hypothetical protein STU22816_29290 [Edwardsiella ictaluri]